jgi:phosphatidylglycerol lysyltransferase
VAEHHIESFSNRIEIIKVCTYAVLINGLYFLYIGASHFRNHNNMKYGLFGYEIIPIIGLTLIYLSFLLYKKKKTAWLTSTLLYFAYLIYFIISHLLFHTKGADIFSFRSLTSLLLPAIILIALLISKNLFYVESDVTNFKFSLKVSSIILAATLIFGSTGYLYMDQRDFHQEITVSGAIHQTIDQFDLTVNKPYIPYTKRAKAFNDSLSIISTLAVIYCVYSLFKPIKLRFFDPYNQRYLAVKILTSGGGDSEDYFKIWPHDKNYLYNEPKTACIAYSVHRGVALAIGDPFGAVSEFSALMNQFLDYCTTNDWLPSFIHTRPHYSNFYKKNGFTLQKIGEEASVVCEKFLGNVVGNKYFRNITNRFEKQGYTTEVLTPPHSKEILHRLRDISNEWLTLPNKAERGLMMGFFDVGYLNSSTIIVLKNQDNIIEAFINKLPSFNTDMASYDMIRHTKQAPGNSIDYLLINFIKYADSIGFKSVNLGLSPLAGVDDLEGENSVLNRTLSFIYANSSRFYSFKGLYRFKQKYAPNWSNRYIAYQRGFPGFIKTMTALNTASKITKK